MQEMDDDAGLENLPEGVQGSYQWLDLLTEGLNGIFCSDFQGEWYYKRNLSAANESATAEGAADPLALGPIDVRKPKFGPLERVAIRPSLRSSDKGPQFLDLEGDGRLNLAITEGPTPGFYCKTDNPKAVPSTVKNVWDEFQAFRHWPNVDMNDPNLRFIDVTGDGIADILISHDDVFTWYEGLGEGGFADGTRVGLGLDEDQGPRILFSDPTESIHLADFSGDGIVDIVRIRNGDVCYWPNVGYGRFGARVAMDNAPHFDMMGAFTFNRLVLGDIDGSGTTDMIYFHDDGATIYYNLAGNGWSDPLHVESLLPMFDSLISVAAVDLLGSGTMCLAWSSSHPSQRQSLRYVDLSGGQKPHLLSKVTTNMGSETRFIYRPSTAYYLDDLAAGTPWVTRLPYPQQCIDRIITYDRISKVSYSQRFAYHHGYYDVQEREFRGFGMVDQWDTEEFESLNIPAEAVNNARETHAPAAHTKKWFHTGAFLDHELLSRAYAKEYFGSPDPNVKGYEVAFEKFFEGQLRDQVLGDLAVMSSDDRREASRALKGSLLRTEMYGDDRSIKASIPYQIVDVGNSVLMIQPRGLASPYAIFQTFAREKIAHYLERNVDDPRISHSLILDVDVFGNVLVEANICYGRKPSTLSKPNPDMEDRDVAKQQETKITFSKNDYKFGTY